MVTGPVPGNRWDLLDGLEPAEPPTVAVIVVHYRQQAELDRTLAAVARQTHPRERTEVVVVDDGSPEPPRVPAGVTLLRQEDRGVRPSAARNLGVEHTTADVLCFLDADTAPEPGYLTAISRLPALAPEAVTVGRRRHADFSGVAVDAPVEAAGPAAELPAPQWLTEAYRHTADLLHSDHRAYRYVIAAVLTCHRDIFAAAGPFDAGNDTYGGEDWEWGHRAWQAGALLAHVPDAVAWHDGPDWAGRGGRLAIKNAETLRLTQRVPVVGSRGHGVRPLTPDVEVHVPAGASAARTFVCVDSVLAALPHAVVRVDPEHAAWFAADHRVGSGGPAGARVRIDLAAVARVRGAGLEAAAERVGVGTLGTLALTDAGGAPLARLTAARAVARCARWDDGSLFETRTEATDALERLDAEPDLEAYLGGWG